MNLTWGEALVARSVRPDLVDGQYEVGTDMDVDINLQYPTPIGHATVIGNGLRVRLQPHATALQVGSLANGDRVEVWGTVGEWSLVRRGDVHGWSATRFLECAQTARSDS